MANQLLAPRWATARRRPKTLLRFPISRRKADFTEKDSIMEGITKTVMKRYFAVLLSLVALTILCGPAAFATDVVQTSVTGVTPAAVVTPNGQGSYSPGQIEILYTVVAPQFAAGPFGSFILNLQDLQKNSTGKSPTYPAPLSLTQTGSTQLELTPDASSFSVTAVGWTGSTTVNISIPQSVVNDSSNAIDGTTLVANLQVSSEDSHLGTNTSVQVKIKLSVPKSSTCLNVYHFATDQDFTQILSSVGVNINKKNNIVATNPGQLSDNTLVVNTCGVPETFDVKVALDSHWQTNPNNNPGNAVFTYNTTGEIDETSFNISSFGLGTPQGQNMCIQNVSVAAGDTFLMAVHMGIITGPNSLLSNGLFNFTGGLYSANSNCNTGTPDLFAAPNPDPYSLTYSTF
jgi:hypothetical protein